MVIISNNENKIVVKINLDNKYKGLDYITYEIILNEYDEYPLPTFVYLSYFIWDRHLTICFHSHISSNFYLIIGAF